MTKNGSSERSTTRELPPPDLSWPPSSPALECAGAPGWEK